MIYLEFSQAFLIILINFKMEKLQTQITTGRHRSSCYLTGSTRSREKRNGDTGPGEIGIGKRKGGTNLPKPPELTERD